MCRAKRVAQTAPEVVRLCRLTDRNPALETCDSRGSQKRRVRSAGSGLATARDDNDDSLGARFRRLQQGDYNPLE